MSSSLPGWLGLRKRPRYSARPFVLTIVTIAVLCLLSWASQELRPTRSAANHQLLRRDVLVQDEECRMVHHAQDKCAFVRANCPDEEAGIFSYLTLYYCRLHHAKPVAFIILVLWLALLFSTIGIAASDFFCVNLSTIAGLLGMSESMAGVTFLAFGNGSPDVFSTFAAMSTNSASLAIGELVGAAGFITAVVAGSMALVRPFNVARRSFIRDVGFFIVAASFSMAFLADGKLHLWESITMVGFYLFYVCFVMVWHWWLGRRKARRRRAATMRSHYVVPGGEEEEVPQDYHDEDDAPASANERTPLQGVSTDDFNALERAGGGGSLEEDDNEVFRERWLGELSSNMRLNRPPVGSRRNTHTPIRPSLVGALEFRAVLTSLQKSRNIQSMPISLRRYSDDPTFTSAQQQDLISTTSDPAPRPPYDVPAIGSDSAPIVSRPTGEIQKHLGNRARAVSTNDIDNVRLDPSGLTLGAVPSIDVGPASPPGEQDDQPHPPLSPSFSLSPPPSQHTSRSASPAPTHTSDRLAPPGFNGPAQQTRRQRTASPSPLSSPRVESTDRPAARALPKLSLPAASPPQPFPPYTDYPFSAHSSSRAPSIRLPSPSASPESFYHGDHFPGLREPAKPPRWWPSIVPAPNILFSTLFPTLWGWRDRSLWEKFLGVISAPSVFLLTMTLPVVETQQDDSTEDDDIPGSLSLPGPLTPVNGSLGSLGQHQRSLATLEPDSPSHEDRSQIIKTGGVNHVSRSSVTANASQPPQLTITTDHLVLNSPEQLPSDPRPSDAKQWNRWLVIVQAFTAPFFIVLIVWANTEIESPRALLRPTLFSLIFSLSLLAVLLTTTTPDRPPRWRTLLCFLGFAVSIAWISSIANEVVGVLKTLGVILNMSDAILGLTIFAVGNSLGDFVADVTVARLGFPVMALSACFGGPMLNILLGIGISGCYMTIKGGKHRHEKHPDRPLRFKPYPIDVSTTLVISAATLLVTLVGLLIVVPMRRWRMDKTIGWGLVALWSASTVVNVIVEVLGLSSNVS
ncbi:Sodium/calcium exchanger protein-domain-containing protein [Lophiotrema nucula]|uniref:Sodium/calcium exchanger protein-domain-containing protein n=1 Tax=Lophiotrema nucula TaxID=690887 RepID=A0A6A5YQ24_9PLEO|nr:Sodium/calcium exchanger protein-domain-containing protein [Lophiotrema nucula]